MIAFDIAVVAQKVKVQCYIMADMLNLKIGCWISSRSGWLLELLTEPIMIATKTFIVFPVY